MQSLSDTELISLFREHGRQDAFTELVNCYQEKLTNTLIVRLGDPDTAEDVVQRVFIRIYKNIHRFDDSKGAFERWLFGAALNLTRNELRGSKVAGRRGSCVSIHSDRDDSPLRIDPAHASVTPGEDMEHAEWRVEFRQFIEALPFASRQAFVLIYVQGLSYTEASKHCGVPAPTLKSRVRVVIGQLQEAFADMPCDVTGLLDGLRRESWQEVA
jgi:RNA polymerase sigma-70 factor (ECF subfamily)